MEWLFIRRVWYHKWYYISGRGIRWVMLHELWLPLFLLTRRVPSYTVRKHITVHHIYLPRPSYLAILLIRPLIRYFIITLWRHQLQEAHITTFFIITALTLPPWHMTVPSARRGRLHLAIILIFILMLVEELLNILLLLSVESLQSLQRCHPPLLNKLIITSKLPYNILTHVLWWKVILLQCHSLPDILPL